MASIAQRLTASHSDHWWLWDWLKCELTPYPGRAGLVARMVIATTLVMIICMTFRIPYAFQGAISVLLISRESIRATLRSGVTIMLATAIGAAYLIVTVGFVLGRPLLQFSWVAGSLFLAFYAISALTSYTAAALFASVISIGVPLWDRHVSAETNVEDTLWLCLATLIGVGMSAGVELVLTRLRPGDEVVSQIARRLNAVRDLLMCYADGRTVDAATEQNLIRLEMLGTSLLRRILQRSNYSHQYVVDMSGVAVVVGSLVDLAAAMTELRFEPAPAERRRCRSLAAALASVRNDLTNRVTPAPIQLDTDEQGPGGVPLLGEMERTVTLIPQVFLGSPPTSEDSPSSEEPSNQPLLVPNAIGNPEHFRFALKGCIAASGSYVIYNAIAWPEISTAVTTCLLTALSTIGASRQKQVLRIAGAIVGGFLLGMGSQIFILPYCDSIAAFTILFALVTALASWFLTSSPRISYFGLQVALAFYLINLQEFKIQTSLGVARNRVVGVLLGLFMMWLVFDRLWGAPAGVEMKRSLISNFRLLAQFAREPLSADLGIAAGRSLALRQRINADLDKTRAYGDGVLFEFGPTRQRDLELRVRIRRWQPQLRTLFVLRIASWKYRAQLPGFELPESVHIQHQAYDEHAAQMLEDMAEWIDRNAPDAGNSIEESHELLNRTVEEIHDKVPEQLPPGRAASFVAILRSIDGLTTSLASEIATEFGTQTGSSHLLPV
jgi:multidrug resistance protein MdtO